jgi:hypothetical protein
MEKWRSVHIPLTLNFAILSLVHAATALTPPDTSQTEHQVDVFPGRVGRQQGKGLEDKAYPFTAESNPFSFRQARQIPALQPNMA